MSIATKNENRDVTILGGGLAGLTCALHCRKLSPDARITVLEKLAHPVPEAAFKVGESTVEVATYYFSQILGLEPHLIADQLPKMGLRFFFGAGDNSTIERRMEIGGSDFPPTPSFQLDRGRFENYLGERCLSQGIEFIDASTVAQVELGRGRKPHRIAYTRKDQRQEILSRWVVDASGRAAILRRQLGLEQPSPHKANAAWFRLGVKINVDDWSTDPDWKQGYEGAKSRWFSTNHLMGEGYWVWLIPLASGGTSLGIVADDKLHPLSTYNSMEKTLEWLEKHEPQCAEKVRMHQAEVQDFKAMKHYAVECKQVFSANRWGILGDAGYFLDPFYSPGSDFIAMGNTFMCRLIKRDLQGQTNLLHAPFYNRLYRTFYRGTAVVFHQQYQLFGNQQVMPVKILWDWMVYWSLTGFNFMHDKTCDPMIYVRHMLKLKKLSDLNRAMQAFFREWHAQSPSQEAVGSIDTSRISIIERTNRGLSDNLAGDAYAKRFASNVVQMESLFWEIIDHANINASVPIKRPRKGPTKNGYFQQIFDVTGNTKTIAPQQPDPALPI